MRIAEANSACACVYALTHVHMYVHMKKGFSWITCFSCWLQVLVSCRFCLSLRTFINPGFIALLFLTCSSQEQNRDNVKNLNRRFYISTNHSREFAEKNMTCILGKPNDLCHLIFTVNTQFREILNASMQTSKWHKA